jgi:hypothetical protein
MRHNVSSFLIGASLLFAVSVVPAYGDDWRWRGDIHHFREHDYIHWREGRWYHGFHNGRGGWWWQVNGLWYYYPTPIYPYPDPYTPPVVVAEAIPVTPVEAAPAYVYFCPNPEGYYPYVSQCFAPWERKVAVVAPPPVQTPVVAPPPAPPLLDQRTFDDRQLNAFAVEFQNIDLRAPHARARLKALEDKVEAYRQALYTRSYNAMDILKDAEGLEKRIAVQRAQLPKSVPKAVAAPPAQ